MTGRKTNRDGGAKLFSFSWGARLLCRLPIGPSSTNTPGYAKDSRGTKLGDNLSGAGHSTYLPGYTTEMW